MPDKYKELMLDQEIDELVAYLLTLKDASVETPKPSRNKRSPDTIAMASLQPKIKSKVRCVDGRSGDRPRHRRSAFAGRQPHRCARERDRAAVPVSAIGAIRGESVELTCNAAQFSGFPELKRQDYVSSKEVEIPHLENRIHVEPGSYWCRSRAGEELRAAVLLRRLHQRHRALIALPSSGPSSLHHEADVCPYDNTGSRSATSARSRRKMSACSTSSRSLQGFGAPTGRGQESLDGQSIPETLKKIYPHGDIHFYDEKGEIIWVNKQTVPYVAFSGKCPTRMRLQVAFAQDAGQVFLCPCHLSIYDVAGTVLDGPAPRPLDVLPIKVSASGDIEVIDVEYKAGGKSRSALPR